MEEEVVEYLATILIPAMQHRIEHRVHIELEDHVCALFSKEDLPHAHIREIKDDPHLFDIWSTLPCDMMTLMRHVVSSLTLI
jgi:hypothetical protein